MPTTWPEGLDGPLTRNGDWIEEAPAALRGIREQSRFHSWIDSEVSAATVSSQDNPTRRLARLNLAGDPETNAHRMSYSTSAGTDDFLAQTMRMITRAALGVATTGEVMEVCRRVWGAGVVPGSETTEMLRRFWDAEMDWSRRSGVNPAQMPGAVEVLDEDRLPDIGDAWLDD